MIVRKLFARDPLYESRVMTQTRSFESWFTPSSERQPNLVGSRFLWEIYYFESFKFYNQRLSCFPSSHLGIRPKRFLEAKEFLFRLLSSYLGMESSRRLGADIALRFFYLAL